MNKITAEDFWKVLTEPPPSLLPVVYRLYYNEDGTPQTYSMESLPGKYIEIDKDTFAAGSFNVRVKNGKLVSVPALTAVSKLKPNISTGTACHPRDICVVVEENQAHTKWSWQ